MMIWAHGVHGVPIRKESGDPHISSSRELIEIIRGLNKWFLQIAMVLFLSAPAVDFTGMTF